MFKIKMLLAIRWAFFLIFMVFLFSLYGCSSKSGGTFDFPEERDRSSQQQVGNGEGTEPYSFEEFYDLSLKQIRNKIRTEALRNHYTSWKGIRYRYGGLSRKGVDCSGFTLLTFKEVFGKSLPRTVREQVKKGKKVHRESLQPGDLVFFKTGVFQKHVGIYLEDDLFMHASFSRGVMISRLDNIYWDEHYWQAKRI